MLTLQRQRAFWDGSLDPLLRYVYATGPRVSDEDDFAGDTCCCGLVVGLGDIQRLLNLPQQPRGAAARVVDAELPKDIVTVKAHPVRAWVAKPPYVIYAVDQVSGAYAYFGSVRCSYIFKTRPYLETGLAPAIGGAVF